MNLRAALGTEFLKSHRSGVPWLVALGYCAGPAIVGLFMIILKDPEAARSMGLISEKANLTAGEASWAAFFNMLEQMGAIAGTILFGMLTAWVFGREFSDRTVKELLAVPTSRAAIVLAKFLVVLGWTTAISILIFGVGLIIGSLVQIPGWSWELLYASTVDFMGASILTIALLPFVAFAASFRRGPLPGVVWLFFAVVLAQVSAVIGWGDYVPWAVPALFSGAIGPRSTQLGMHSYIILLSSSLIGILITLLWWRNADQAR